MSSDENVFSINRASRQPNHESFAKTDIKKASIKIGSMSDLPARFPLNRNFDCKVKDLLVQPDPQTLKEVNAKILEVSIARMKSKATLSGQQTVDRVLDVPNKKVSESNRFFVGRSSGKRLFEPHIKQPRPFQSTRKIPSANFVQSLMSIPEPEGLHSVHHQYRNQCSAKEIDGLNRFTKGKRQSEAKKNFLSSKVELI